MPRMRAHLSAQDRDPRQPVVLVPVQPPAEDARDLLSHRRRQPGSAFGTVRKPDRRLEKVWTTAFGSDPLRLRGQAGLVDHPDLAAVALKVREPVKPNRQGRSSWHQQEAHCVPDPCPQRTEHGPLEVQATADFGQPLVHRQACPQTERRHRLLLRPQSSARPTGHAAADHGPQPRAGRPRPRPHPCSGGGRTGCGGQATAVQAPSLDRAQEDKWTPILAANAAARPSCHRYHILSVSICCARYMLSDSMSVRGPWSTVADGNDKPSGNAPGSRNRLPAKVHLRTCNKPAGCCTPGWQSAASIWAEALQTLSGSAGTGGLQRPFHIHRDYPQTIFRTGVDVFQNVIADIGTDLR